MTTTTTQAAGTTGNQASAGRLFGQALLGGAAAAVVNLVLFFAAKAAGVAMTGEFQPGAVGELPMPAVAISSVVSGLFAALAALLFQKFTTAAARNFALLAAVFCVLSLIGPARVKEISTGTIVVMELMHVVAAIGIGGMVYRALRRD